MDFGKKIYAGNFFMVKKTRSLSRREAKKLRDEENIPVGIRDVLTRGGLPYIRVENVGLGWAFEVSVGMTMFDALDDVTVARDERGDLRVVGEEGENVKALLTMMMANTTTVGDAECQRDMLMATGRYLERAAKGNGAEMGK